MDVSFWQSTVLECNISSASGKQHPTTLRIRICRSTKLALDLNIEGGNLSKENKIDALIGHCTCAAWKNSAHNISSQRHCTAGLAEVDSYLSSTENATYSAAEYAETPPVPLFVLLVANCCHATLVNTRYLKSRTHLTQHLPSSMCWDMVAASRWLSFCYWVYHEATLPRDNFVECALSTPAEFARTNMYNHFSMTFSAVVNNQSPS